MLSRVLLMMLPGLLLLSACAYTPDLTSRLSPHRIDVRQGNYVTQDMVAKLKPGMSRDQVRFVLGTPLVTDIFRTDRWDYIYRFQPGHGALQTRRLIVYFEDDRLVRVAGDVVAATEAATEPAAATRAIAVPAP